MTTTTPPETRKIIGLACILLNFLIFSFSDAWQVILTAFLTLLHLWALIHKESSQLTGASITLQSIFLFNFQLRTSTYMSLGCYLTHYLLLVLSSCSWRWMAGFFGIHASSFALMSLASPEQNFEINGAKYVFVALVVSMFWQQRQAHGDEEMLRAFQLSENQRQNLQKRINELEKLVLEKENILLSFSHELRNPLNGLLGYLSMAESKTPDGELTNYLQKASICAEVLHSGIATILDYDQIENNLFELSPAQTDMPKLLETVWKAHVDLIRSKNLVGYLYVSQNFPQRLNLDARRLSQVLFNLIGNAVKFTDKGQICVTVDWIPAGSRDNHSAQNIANVKTPREDTECIDFSAMLLAGESDTALEGRHLSATTMGTTKNSFKSMNHFLSLNKLEFSRTELSAMEEAAGVAPEGALIFRITDSGCGIRKELQEQLFSRLSNTEGMQAKRLGAGLGLWTSRKIINIMGGDIRVCSREQVGSVFKIILPAKAVWTLQKGECELDHLSKTLLSNDLNSTQSQTSRQLRAMVVDDIPYNQIINKHFLEKCGVTVVKTALNGEEAVRAYTESAAGSYEVITMDLEMPLMDGKTAIKLIREHEKRNGWKPVKIFIISGNCRSSVMQECLDAQGEYRVTEFLAKPVHIARLEQAIKNL